MSHDTSAVPAHERILVALDTPEIGPARELAAQLAGAVGGFKVGLELFTHGGPAIVRELRETGAGIFLDLKLHDIPNTVAGAAAAAGSLGVRWMTVHASGGPEMIAAGARAAAEAAAAAGHPAPVILAVTILTSMDAGTLETVGLAGPCEQAVVRLAGVARDAGAGGLVCSPLEVTEARRVFPTATLVVPGIRPASGSVVGDDQARTATPAQAVADGADRLVIGRPITRADDPRAAAEAIARQIESGA